MQYPRLDLSPAQGSSWLRELVLHDFLAVDEEEMGKGVTASLALRLRWYRFICVKRFQTKHAVLFAVVDGTNLLEFAVRRAAACSKIARTLLYCIAYMVLVEHPKLLTPQELSAFLTLTRRFGLKGVYETGMDALQRRLSQAFSSHDLLGVENVVSSGFPAGQVVQSLYSHALRDSNVVVWRSQLKHCLGKYGVDVDLFLENIMYDDDDQDSHLFH
jgi:hypothetical protein